MKLINKIITIIVFCILITVFTLNEDLGEHLFWVIPYVVLHSYLLLSLGEKNETRKSQI